jgi:hypothetical protein
VSYSSRFTELLHHVLSHDIFSATEQHVYIHKATRMCLDDTKPVVISTKMGTYETRIGLSILMRTFITFIVDQLIFGIESYIPTNSLLYTIINWSKMSVLKHLKTLQHVSIHSHIIFRELVGSFLKSLNLKVFKKHCMLLM